MNLIDIGFAFLVILVCVAIAVGGTVIMCNLGIIQQCAISLSVF